MSTRREPEAGTELTLDELADAIRAQHKLVERLAGQMVAVAVSAGEMLVQAKGRLRHGEWGPYLVLCGVNARSARVYMQLARKRQHAAVLGADSIRAALKALAGPPKPKPKPLDLGPACGPTYAWNAEWQVAAWREAMIAAGRPLTFGKVLVLDTYNQCEIGGGVANTLSRSPATAVVVIRGGTG